MDDCIIIEDLEVTARVGVGARERQRPQRLLITVEMPISLKKAGRSDEIRDTVDYFEVAKTVRRVAAGRPRRLIEKLASDVGREILQHFPLKTVKISIKKFILKRTRSVGVRLTMTRVSS
ncbi:MAG: dihydroneopterin aldolase [Verrucomicrobiae bacterium]|nr:dihydroneopterin aldolase [Verrucomicrobiae bacterium]